MYDDNKVPLGCLRHFQGMHYVDFVENHKLGYSDCPFKEATCHSCSKKNTLEETVMVVNKLLTSTERRNVGEDKNSEPRSDSDGGV